MSTKNPNSIQFDFSEIYEMEYLQYIYIYILYNKLCHGELFWNNNKGYRHINITRRIIMFMFICFTTPWKINVFASNIVSHHRVTCPGSGKYDNHSTHTKETAASRIISNSSRFLELVSDVNDIEMNGASLYDLDNNNYGFLYNYLTGVGAHNFNDTIIIGFLGAYGQIQVILGALPLAVEAVNRDPDLLPGRRLEFLAADIGTSAAGMDKKKRVMPDLSVRAMTQMRDLGAIAFIGPDDSCYTEALVAAAWNLPIISYKCADSVRWDGWGDGRRGRGRGTFARTLPPSSKVSKSVVALLRAFHWHTFAMVAGERPAAAVQQMEAIRELAEEHQMTVAAERRYSDYIPTHIAEMDQIVEETYQWTRVYVFLGEHIALVDFVSCLHRRHLLDNGEYIVVSVDDKIYDPGRRHDITQTAYLDPFLNNTKDLFAFRSVLKLTPSHPSHPHYKEMCEMIRALSALPPFCVPNYHKIFDSITVPIEAAHLYDAVMIYARALSESLAAGEDPRNGSAVMSRILSRSYRSMQGYDVVIDSNGDAEGNFTVVTLLDDHQMNSSSLRMSMQPVGYFRYAPNVNTSPFQLPEFLYTSTSRGIQWVGGAPPRPQPECGFGGELCRRAPDWRLWVLAAFVAVVAFLASVFLLRHYRYEQKLACLLWKMDFKEITMIPIEDVDSAVRNKSMIQVCRHSLFGVGEVGAGAGAGAGVQETTEPRRAFTKVGLYRGNIVAIKPIHKRTIDITRAICKELKQIREVRHENLIPFIGACVDNGNICIVTSYCARGSLEDVLSNEDLHIDHMFVSSLVSDIIKGLTYIHESDIVSHGNLRSSNCLVDSRWVLQITDFGLHEFKGGQEEPDAALREERRALWRAPELLRAATPPARGSQRADVYSFAIVLYEIVGRKGPWGQTDLSNSEILGRVRHPIDNVYCRPPLSGLDAAPYMLCCMQSCWDEDPEQRPDIRFVRVKLKEMHAGLKPNIFDNMLAIMEKYAYNLEGLVADRTEQLVQEKRRTDQLLHRMLPKTVVDSLKSGDPVEAESFSCVTIYFSDIVGFTELSADSTPMQVVELLNDLYTCCDSIISHYDVYKVETIGDAYMVVSGLPVRNGDRHAAEIASMALHLLAMVKKLEVRHRPGTRLMLRIGIHSGQCAAGVVGLKMPRYCLFGDTVNTASRMESSGEPLRIHVSQATHRLLIKIGGYLFEERGLTMIKGKGEMVTYWLLGEEAAQKMARARRDASQSTLLASCASELACGDLTPDLLRRGPGSGVHQLRARARFSCGHGGVGGVGASEEFALPGAYFPTPVGFGSALSVPGPASACACFDPYRSTQQRSHRSAPAVTFKYMDYADV